MRKEKWSKEKIWEWHRSQPWLRGCNFMGSDCCNRVDQWQEYGFEERFKTVGEELALASSVGYNSIRIILQFEVWDQEHDGFMQRLERYIALAHKNGISTMVCFGNDCTVPKESEAAPKMGPQRVDVGYHGGRKKSPHGVLTGPGYSILDEPELAERFCDMVREIINKYADDSRVVVWDLFNEPGGGKRESRSLPHMIRFFEIAREIDPIQPLTACAWDMQALCAGRLSEIETAAFELSDIISFHCYGAYEEMIHVIDILKTTYGRPMLCTEWLHRLLHNDVESIYPLFYLEEIGCYNWGFVAGKYQTYEPWDSLWARYEQGGGKDIDFTKWQHDLFRPSFRPYDPKEIELIKRFNHYADEKIRRDDRS